MQTVNYFLYFFRIDKLIAEKSGCGNNFISELSDSLKSEFSVNNGYSPSNLAIMRIFYEAHKDLSILSTPLAKLP